MSTWASLEEMRRGIMMMLQDNEYFAWQKDNGIYLPCYDLNELEQYKSLIFEGSKTPGFYPITQDNKTRWGGLDFDDHENKGLNWRPKAEKAFNALSSRFDECWFLETHEGGFHVIPFSSDPLAASEMKRILSEYAPSDVEVFPKQGQLSNKRTAKGNLLRFPGKHQKKGFWSKFIGRSGQIVLQKKENIYESSYRSSHNLAGIYFRATRGIYVTNFGQRFRAMQKIAGRLKGRVTEKEAIQIYTKWHNQVSSKIRTDFKESLQQFVKWFRDAEPCRLEIPAYQPNEEEQTRIMNLPISTNIRPELLHGVAKLFLKVQKHADRKGLRECFLSCEMIAKELSISIPTASRYRIALVEARFVELVQRGRTGLASTYRIKE